MGMDLTGYNLTFNDDFNSFTSSPDGNGAWKTEFYFGGRSLPSNGEQQYYSDSSVGVDPFHIDNGALVITATPGSNPDGLSYNSGLITTEGTFTQTYGYFEMRAQLPQGQGMWPAFWMMNADKSWPPELDILEAFGATNANGEGGQNAVHVNAISHALSSSGASQGAGDWVNIPSNVYDGFHTYGVDWQPDHLTYYVDGQQVFQTATPSDMNQPMYMLANLAVGGSWAGNATGETGEMKIDYIRAYSNDPNASTVSVQPASPGVDTASSTSTNAAPDSTPAPAPAASPVSVQPASAGVDTASHSTDTASHASTNAAPDSIPAPALADSTAALGTGSSAITLHVSADAWNGDAQFKVFVDEQQAGNVQTATANHSAGQWQDVTVNGTFDGGPHTVAIEFINDAWGGNSSADRNLYVGSIDMNGQQVAGDTAANNAANGAEWADPHAAALMINGTATFDVPHSTADMWHV